MNWSVLLQRLQPFLAGAFGGVSPFILRIALGLANEDQTAKAALRDGGWILGVFVLGLIGGGVAAVWEEKNLKKAFQLGLGLPSLLTVFTTSATAPKSAFDQLFPSETVYAADTSVPGRRLKVDLPAEVSKASMNALFNDSPTGRLTVPFTAGMEIDVPAEARSVEIKSDLFDVEPVVLPKLPNRLIELVFGKVEKKPFYGFLYSIGIQSHAYKLGPPRIITNPR